MGTYEIISILGKGGMSTVYKGVQPSLDRLVAIKVLPLQFAKQDNLLARFERESSIIANLNHANIIQVIDRGTSHGTYYIVMELVEGCSLDELVEQKDLPIYQVVNICMKVAMAMEYAHSKGVVHRDIKPGNVLISSENGSVKVTDFGIAHFSEEQLSGRALTQEYTAIGTMDYMAPEQKRNARNCNARSDIYSFGVMLYEVLTGRVPAGHFKEPQELRDDTPPLLNRTVLRCLNDDPADRYASFSEIISELKRLTQKELVYREALAKMAQSVRHIPKKAKTIFSKRAKALTNPNWNRKGVILGSAVILAAILFIIFLPAGILDRGTSEQHALKTEAAHSVPQSEQQASKTAAAHSVLKSEDSGTKIQLDSKAQSPTSPKPQPAAGARVIGGEVVSMAFAFSMPFGKKRGTMVVKDSNGKEHTVHIGRKTAYVPKRYPKVGDKVTIKRIKRKGEWAATQVLFQ